MPWLAKFASRSADTPVLWTYYWDTIDACAPPGRVMDTLTAAGFLEVNRHLELGIFSEYRAGKPAHAKPPDPKAATGP